MIPGCPLTDAVARLLYSERLSRGIIPFPAFGFDPPQLHHDIQDVRRLRAVEHGIQRVPVLTIPRVPQRIARRLLKSVLWQRMAQKFKIAASSRARLRSRPSANWKLRIMQRIFLRDRIWRVESATRVAEDMTLFRLFDPTNADRLEALCPPEEFEPLAEESPSFSRNAVAPFETWQSANLALKLSCVETGQFAAFYGGRISPEHYQFAPVARMLQLPRPSLLIADDVGLGKTIEAGICLLELIARGRGKRILLVVPPGLIAQWQDEMLSKFGLKFEAIENAAALERAQTRLSEGVKPWVFLNRVITSIEYLKKREILSSALEPQWDAIVVDEAHYLAESGTPKSPYMTARARLGPKLREFAKALILLSATPHNGYSHSFRSLVEIIEPTDASFRGDKDVIARRVGRSMIRRLKAEITKSDANGERIPAFKVREPVKSISVTNLAEAEKAVFKKISSYCAKTAAAAAQTDDAELVSFAMQIIKKRMLSSRAALARTVKRRLEALTSRAQQEEPPARSEIRELQGDLPLNEKAHERIATRVVRAAISKDAKRRTGEKKQLQEIQKLIDQVQSLPDPKIEAFIADLEADVLSQPGEKAIIFTEYLDTLSAIKTALTSKPEFKDCFVELTGGLSSKKRQTRLAEFETSEKRLLLATDAASEGLNLQQSCRRIYHFELSWNPNRMEQRNGRVDRHGQTRNPIIRYLFYPDSPEDNILDRLVKRIAQMQSDKVSTPDILGILAGQRIEDALTELDAEDDTAVGDKILSKLDEGRDLFLREVAPLLMSGAVSYGAHIDPTSMSADHVMQDDAPFEQFILSRLRPYLKPGRIPHTFSLRTPREFQGAQVAESYPCLTFRRTVAIQYPARDVEFVTRLHPLFQAIAKNSFRHLTAARDPNASSARLAVRRHPYAGDGPYAVFTYLCHDDHEHVEFLSVAVDRSGNVLPSDQVIPAFDTNLPPGEVGWSDVANVFDGKFEQMQAAASAAAVKSLEQKASRDATSRQGFAAVLREDAERYRADRLAEIDAEEKQAQAIEDQQSQQLLLDRREVYGFKAKRAAADTFLKRRLEEIAKFEQGTKPGTPQPLGALFVFPPEGNNGA
jgi:ERCC4-related helicase